MLILIGLPQANALDGAAAYYRNLEPCAVTVDVEARSQGVSTSFRYHVFRRGEHAFRVDLETSLPDGSPGERYTVWSNGKQLIALAERANRYVENAFTPESSRSANMIAVFGQLEPFMTVLLDPDGGLKAFTDRLGATAFRAVGSKVVGDVGADGSSLLEFELEDRGAIRSARLTSAGLTVASWKVTTSLQTVEDALTFAVPATATRVRSLSGGEPPPAEFDAESRAIVERSKDAFAKLASLSYRASAYLFVGEKSETRTANCWWERGGKLRYACTVRNASSVEALFDGKTLLAYDRRTRVGYRGVVSRRALLDTLAAIDCPLDAMVIGLAGGSAVWARLAPPGCKVSLLPSQSTSSADAVESITRDGWRAVIYVRKADGLIERIERTQTLDSAVAVSETVIFTITAANSPIPARAWAFSLPTNTTVKPLPAID
jgi:hypothetical protein